MKIAVFGATGMIGSRLVAEADRRDLLMSAPAHYLLRFVMASCAYGMACSALCPVRHKRKVNAYRAEIPLVRTGARNDTKNTSRI